MVFSRTKSTDATADPTSKKAFRKLSDFPDYRESKDRLDELTEQRRELQVKIDGLTAEIGEGDSDGRDAIRAQAADLVSGGVATAIAKPNVRIELNAANTQIAIVAEAVKMQAAAVSAVAETCQVEMIAERKPAHIAIVAEMDIAMSALEQAFVDERFFRKQAIRDGLDTHDLHVITTPENFGYQREKSWENFHQWRLRMSRIGYITYNGRRN